jgi:hypothetical protein
VTPESNDAARQLELMADGSADALPDSPRSGDWCRVSRRELRDIARQVGDERQRTIAEAVEKLRAEGSAELAGGYWDAADFIEEKFGGPS